MFPLKNCDRSYTVSTIQFLLRQYFNIKPARLLVSDGFYGEKTAIAVSRFQKRENLPVTGECDKQTWEKLHQETGRIAEEVHT